MRLHEELDAHAQTVRLRAGQLARDAVAHVEPQLLALTSGVLQPEIIRLDNAKLLTHLQSQPEAVLKETAVRCPAVPSVWGEQV